MHTTHRAGFGKCDIALRVKRAPHLLTMTDAAFELALLLSACLQGTLTVESDTRSC